jgi:hypothetical protein
MRVQNGERNRVSYHFDPFRRPIQSVGELAERQPLVSPLLTKWQPMKELTENQSSVPLSWQSAAQQPKKGV